MRAFGKREWPQLQLVQRCVEEMDQSLVKGFASKGWFCLYHGVPLNQYDRPWEAPQEQPSGLVWSQNWLTNVLLRPRQNMVDEEPSDFEEEPHDDDENYDGF